MKIAISGNLTERIPIDLALVIAMTLACIFFVLTPRLNETASCRWCPGLLLVLFLPGYSLVAALFPGKDDPDGTRADLAQFWSRAIAVVPLTCPGLEFTRSTGAGLVPVLLGLSLFMVLPGCGLRVCGGCGLRVCGGCGCPRRSGLWLGAGVVAVGHDEFRGMGICGSLWMGGGG